MRNKKEKRERGKEREVSFRPSLSQLPSPLVPLPPLPSPPLRRLQRKLISMYPIGHEPIYNIKLQVKNTGQAR